MAFPHRPSSPPVSSSAPPSFRARKKKPGESNPSPANEGRLTGPPMQKGPGQDSMFARGRTASPPQYRMPPPSRPGAMGGHGKPMMADGGFGDPGAIDQDQDAAPDVDDVQPQTEGKPAGEMPIIKPEAVNYHDDAQSCSGCQYMGEGGQCSVLQMAVSPEGACNAFEHKGMDQGIEGPPPGGGPMSDSGNPPLS